MNQEIVCIAKFEAIKGKEETLLNSLYSLIKDTRDESGCIRYELNQSIDNKRVITFVEKWSSMDSFNAHCKMDYIVNYFENIAPNLVESQDITLHKEII
jgi:quinol monooxygenase YgiN